jgi:hypothetical protein
MSPTPVTPIGGDGQAQAGGSAGRREPDLQERPHGPSVADEPKVEEGIGELVCVAGSVDGNEPGSQDTP